MIEVYQKAPIGQIDSVDDIIVLDHIQRERGRLKITSRNGSEVRLFLTRGNVLKRNELLQSSCNQLLRVELAKEPVITARANSWPEFSRACYHLGNRHVRLQLGDMWLRFMKDSVLVDLVKSLGLSAVEEQAEFEPESGAYGLGHAGKAPNQHVHNH